MTSDTKPKPMPISEQIAGLMQALPILTARLKEFKDLERSKPEDALMLDRLNALLKTAILVRDNEAKIRTALKK